MVSTQLLITSENLIGETGMGATLQTNLGRILRPNLQQVSDDSRSNFSVTWQHCTILICCSVHAIFWVLCVLRNTSQWQLITGVGIQEFSFFSEFGQKFRRN